MLHVVLLILKIIGWILLGLLGLILGLVLLILFVPIRYRVDGSYYGEPKGTARITWLLHMISVKASLDEDFDLSVRLFGFPVLPGSGRTENGEEEDGRKDGDSWAENGTDGLDDDDDQEMLTGDEITAMSVGDPSERRIIEDPLCEDRPPADAERTAEELPETEYTEEQLSDSELKSESAQEQPENPETEPSGKWSKISGFLSRVLEKIKFLFYTVCDKLNFIKENYHMVLEFLKDEENKKTIRLVCHRAKAVIRHILPLKASGKVIFGFDDPYTTGQALAAASIFYAWYGQNIEIVPMFEETVLEGELNIKGRIRIGTLIWHCLMVYRNKNFRILLKRLMGKEPSRRTPKRRKKKEDLKNG